MAEPDGTVWINQGGKDWKQNGGPVSGTRAAS